MADAATIADVLHDAREANRFVRVHPGLVRALEGDAAAAMLVAWINYRLDTPYEDRAIHVDRDGTRWLRAPWADYEEATGLNLGMIRRKLERLAELGVIQRMQGVRGPADRAFAYRVDRDCVIQKGTVRRIQQPLPQDASDGEPRAYRANGEPRAIRANGPRAIRANGPRAIRANDSLLDVEEDPLSGERLPATVEAVTADSTAAQPRTRARTRRDDLWDALCAAVGWDSSRLSPQDRKRLGRVVTAMVQRDATPEQIETKALTYRAVMPECILTLEALDKHWQNLNEGNVRVATGDTRRERDQAAKEARWARVLADDREGIL